MSNGICRVQKVSGASGGVGAYIHNERIKEHSNSNPDIDFSRSSENYHIGEYDEARTYNQRAEKRLSEGYKGKKAVRKDAVKLVEVLFTSDKAFFENQPDNGRAYFKDCLKWASERFGADNIIADVVHLDEATPHMHLDFVPLTEDGRLSAKDVLGDKKKLQALQDDFYEKVSKKYGLDRGQRANLDAGESGRKNLTVQELKQKTLQEDIKRLNMTKRKLAGECKTLKADINNLTKIRDVSLNEYAAIAESTNQIKAFLKYTQIEEPKTDLGKRVVALWKEFVELWEQKNPDYKEKRKASVRDMLNENRQIVAKKEAERSVSERHPKSRGQER